MPGNSREVNIVSNVERFGSLQISSLDDDVDEDEPSNNGVLDDVSHEDEEEDRLPVTLGILEKPSNAWALLRQYFPSKAGGSPAWLDPIHLPSGKSSLCDFCGEPMQFMLQIYAPLSEKESTFHRTLFVFMCTSMTCLLRDQHEQWKRHPEIPSRSVKVFRCQLPLVNSFYSSNPPAEDVAEQPLSAVALLCNWCGTWKGDKICGSCRRARYCSAQHQAAHWKSTSSSHRILCQQLETSGEKFVSAASDSLWPEYEITNVEECELEDETSNDNESVGPLISRSRADDSLGQLQTYFNGHGDNRSWASFQERISLAPEQVLRYSRSAQAKPLWPVSSGRPSEFDIPKCNYCGGNCVFEFQVLPQLLYFFRVADGENSLDWATIAVYTCEASCEGPLGYKEEFAWVQLASQSL